MLFRMRVNVWSRICGYGAFDWNRFEMKLATAEFRRFANAAEACQSMGWAGIGGSGHWLFAVAGYRVVLFGKAQLRHELFHAVQDTAFGLFGDRRGLLRHLAIEYSAHFWGGPLIGSFVYGGTGLIVPGAVYVVNAIFQRFAKGLEYGVVAL